MFRKKFLPGVCFAFLLGATPCIADGDFYDDFAEQELSQDSSKDSGVYFLLGVGMGDTDEITYSSTDYDTDSRVSYDVGIGYRFNPNLRVEATYGHNKLDVDNSSTLFDDVTAKNFFLTGLYDISVFLL